MACVAQGQFAIALLCCHGNVGKMMPLVLFCGYFIFLYFFENNFIIIIIIKKKSVKLKKSYKITCTIVFNKIINK